MRSTEWAEFNFETRVWTIPGPKVKDKRPHRIALTPQTIEIMSELQKLNGQDKFLFPSIRSAKRFTGHYAVLHQAQNPYFREDHFSGGRPREDTLIRRSKTGAKEMNLILRVHDRAS